jgi:hypothetical protein
MRALPESRGKSVFFLMILGIVIRDLDTLRVSQPEDRATLESDPSAALEAEKRRGFKAPAAREFRGEVRDLGAKALNSTPPAIQIRPSSFLSFFVHPL